jgi:hypothetical protein
VKKRGLKQGECNILKDMLASPLKESIKMCMYGRGHYMYGAAEDLPQDIAPKTNITRKTKETKLLAYSSNLVRQNNQRKRVVVSLAEVPEPFESADPPESTESILSTFFALSSTESLNSIPESTIHLLLSTTLPNKPIVKGKGATTTETTAAKINAFLISPGAFALSPIFSAS